SPSHSFGTSRRSPTASSIRERHEPGPYEGRANLPRSVDHDERRRDIARAAIRLLARNGPRGLTLRALADELGGSITLVTHFFPNRRALLDAVTSQVIEDSATDLASAERAQLAPAERLRAFLRGLLPPTPETLPLRRSPVLPPPQ